MTKKPCQKCVKRQLVLAANDAFRDKRIAKKWLNDVTNGYLDNKKPIEAVVDPKLKPEYVLMEMYMAAAYDKTLFDRETYEQRMDRWINTVSLTYKFSKAVAKDWLNDTTLSGFAQKPSQMLKTDTGTQKFQREFAARYYGIYQ